MSKKNSPDIKVFISSREIQQRTCELGREISRDFAGEEVFFICILKGAFLFFSDLIRSVTVPLEIGFMGCASYGNETVSSGKLHFYLDLKEDIKGKNVIVVEDIVDTGLTIQNICKSLKAKGPKKLKVASLLSKPSCRKVDISIDYLGFEIEDQFVIGYGLDYEQKLRELPYIGVLRND